MGSIWSKMQCSHLWPHPHAPDWGQNHPALYSQANVRHNAVWWETLDNTYVQYYCLVEEVGIESCSTKFRQPLQAPGNFYRLSSWCTKDLVDCPSNCRRIRFRRMKVHDGFLISKIIKLHAYLQEKGEGGSMKVGGQEVKLGIPGGEAFQQMAVEMAIPLKRMGTAKEAAGAMLLLASPYASFISGQSLEVTGGPCSFLAQSFNSIFFSVKHYRKVFLLAFRIKIASFVLYVGRITVPFVKVIGLGFLAEKISLGRRQR